MWNTDVKTEKHVESCGPLNNDPRIVCFESECRVHLLNIKLLAVENEQIQQWHSA